MTRVQQWLAIGLVTVTPVVCKASQPLFSDSSRAADGPAVVDAAPGASAPLRVSDQTQVPGKTLKPGSYTIRIVDRLSDRMIVQVDHNGKTESTFLALPVSSLPKPPGRGPITVSGSKSAHSALRGFVFANGTVAEFVYPKAEAVSLAKANSTTIPAIDPASEGMAKASDLSGTDLQTVTLWMLSPTLVGPNDSGAGISAARYQLPAAKSADSPQVASVKPPTRPARVRPAALKATALPHTASETPMVWLFGLVSLLGASGLALRRRAGQRDTRFA